MFYFFKKVTNGRRRGEKRILKPSNKLSPLSTIFYYIPFLKMRCW